MMMWKTGSWLPKAAALKQQDGKQRSTLVKPRHGKWKAGAALRICIEKSDEDY